MSGVCPITSFKVICNPLSMGNQQNIGNAAADFAHEKVVETFFKAGWKVKKLADDLYIQAFSDMGNYLTIGAEGQVQVNTLDTLKKKSKAIRKIKEKRRILSTDKGDTILEDTLEFELYDSLAAKRIGIDILGLNAPTKQDVKFPDKDGNPQEIGGMFTDMERAAKLVYLLDQASKRD